MIACSSIGLLVPQSPSPLVPSSAGAILDRFTGILGILAVLLAAWLGSTNRSKIRWRTVAWGLGLQVLFAFFVLKFTFGQQFMTWAGGVVNSMLSATTPGTPLSSGDPAPPTPAP